MIDIEEELRSALREDALAAPPPPDGLSTLKRARRRQARLVVTTFIVAAAVVAGSIVGVTSIMRASDPRPSGPEPHPPTGLPEDLQGVWRSLQAHWEPGSGHIYLFPCVVGEDCGYLTRLDQDHHRYCTYTLTLQSLGGYRHTFETSGAEDFDCGWSPWSNSVVLLVVRSDGTLSAAVQGLDKSSVPPMRFAKSNRPRDRYKSTNPFAHS